MKYSPFQTRSGRRYQRALSEDWRPNKAQKEIDDSLFLVDALPSPVRPLESSDSVSSLTTTLPLHPSPAVSTRAPPHASRRLPLRLRYPDTRWMISADHPVKLLWDFLTMILSFMNAYATHVSIRDRNYGGDFQRFCEVWFFIDILLNFVTHYVYHGVTLKSYQAVWSRYLLTWFVVDALSLIPGEMIYIKPIIEQQNRRSWLKKSFFRTKAAIRVTTALRQQHFRLFGSVVSHTKHAGYGPNRLLRMLIKYVPKYLLFFRNMRTFVVIRILRQIHYVRKARFLYLNRRRADKDSETASLSTDDYEFLPSDEDWEPDGAPF